MATVTFYYTDIGLVPLNGRYPRLQFRLEGGAALSKVGGRVLSQAPVEVSLDTSGFCVVDLIGNDELQGNTTYTLVGDYLGGNGGLADSIDIIKGLYITGVGGALTDFIPGAVEPTPPFPDDQLLASHVATMETGPTRAPAHSDLAASLTPDGRTEFVLLTGQTDQVYTALTLGMTQSSDTTRVKAGTASRRLAVNASGIFKADWVEAKTFGPASILQAWVWIDEPEKITSIAIRPCSLWTRSAFAPFTPGWNLLRFRASEGVITSWGTVDYVRITVTTTAATAINIGKVWVECPRKAQICFIEDRGYKTFKDIGLPDLRALGIPVTWALDPATHGSSAGTTSEVITDADAATFYAAGDDLSLHGYDGFPTSGKTPAEIREDSLKALAWLQERGYSRGRAWRAAWVQNSAPNHAAAQPYFAAYATPNGGSSTQSWPLVNKWNIARWTIHGKSNAAIDALFVTLQATNEIVFPYTHGVDDVLSGAVTNATWDYFVSKCSAAVAAGWLEGVTFTQLLARSGNIVR